MQPSLADTLLSKSYIFYITSFPAWLFFPLPPLAGEHLPHPTPSPRLPHQLKSREPPPPGPHLLPGSSAPQPQPAPRERGGGGGLCLPRLPCPARSTGNCLRAPGKPQQPPPSSSQLGCALRAAEKPPLSLTAASPFPLCAQRRGHQPRRVPPAPPALLQAGWPCPAPSCLYLLCQSRAWAAHSGESRGAPLHPASPPDSLSAPGKARYRPRLDISLQALQLCSFPWQQQTHNYRYIILYKPKRALRQECEVHLLAASSQAQEAAPREMPGGMVQPGEDAQPMDARQRHTSSGCQLREPAAPSRPSLPAPLHLSGGRQIKPSTATDLITKLAPGKREPSSPVPPQHTGSFAEVVKGSEWANAAAELGLGLLPPYSILATVQAVTHWWG